jgi:hypothetical protein
MSGYLGADFDTTKPDDGDSVRYGASWIRDVKKRLKLFCSQLFNLETGQLKDKVVRPESLRDNGVTPGTYGRVKVNSKGLVTEGVEDDTQQVAQYYRALFIASGTGGDSFVETATGVEQTANTEVGNYPGGAVAPFVSTPYGINCGGDNNYCLFVFTPPAGVRRVKATIIGAGGAGYDTGPGFWGGGGGELVETTFAVDGSGAQSLNIIVGMGSVGDGTGTIGDGCPSRVALSDTVFADAGPGKAALTSAGGGVVSGEPSTSAVLALLRSLGLAGENNLRGAGGSAYSSYGLGGDSSKGADGLVVLEWVA